MEAATTVIVLSLTKSVVAVAPFLIVALRVSVPLEVTVRIPVLITAPVPPALTMLQTIFWFVALTGATLKDYKF